ncbi:MAG: AAA family ATPase [Bacteroidetes bacterium]|nr:AAA family ATPase [Bacteroidota bacterium]MCW5896709.1 AAA family ATPase [Bacteroidota bacterium]
MYLKSVSIRNFKTILNLDIDFSEGLNVIFGLNEAGKSTFLEALTAVFFINADSASRDVGKFRPWGTEADPYVEVKFLAGGNEYKLEKEFLGSRRARLSCSAIRLDSTNKDKINEELAKLLPLGVGSEDAHKRTFWIAQRELEDTIELLHAEADIRTALQSTIMKADGDIEAIKTSIEVRRKAIGVGWGRPATYPGPLELSRREAERLEAEAKELRTRLTSLDTDIQRHKHLTVQASTLENEIKEDGDVLAAIEKYNAARKLKESTDAALDTIQEEIDSHQHDEARLLALRKTIADLVERQGILDRLLTKAQSAEEVNRLRSQLQEDDALLETITNLETKIGLLQQKQAAEQLVPKADVDNARALEKSIATKQAELRAAQLSVEAKGLRDVQLNIAEDTAPEHTEALKKDETKEFRANERISLTLPDAIQLMITSGVTSAVTLHKELQESESSLNDLLTRHTAVSATQLAEKHEAQRKLQSDVNALQTEKRGALRGRTKEDVQNSVTSLRKEVQEKGAQDRGSTSREPVDDLRRQRDQVVVDVAAARAEVVQLDSNAKRFIERHGSVEAAHQKRKEIAREASKAEAAFEETPKMELSDDQVFLKKQRLEKNKASLDKARADLLRLSGALQATSVSSDAVRLKEAELQETRAAYQTNLLEYEAYQILEKTLEKAEIEVSRHLSEPIKNILSVTLPRLTSGRYSQVNLDDTLEVQSIRYNALDVDPADLSTGAKGQLALALRLALVDHLSGKERQMIVLDDALVNFDGDRLAEAKRLFVEVAARHQILYLTCHSETADIPGSVLHHL